jgi:hypothetical protein
MFQLRLMRRCGCDEVAGSPEMWEPDVRRLLWRTHVLQRRTTIALILEAVYDFVESQSSLRARRHGRWLLAVWVDAFRREAGGLVLDYRDARSPEEMQCVPYLYMPIAFGGESDGRARHDDLDDSNLPCADQTEGGSVDARLAYDEWGSWSRFSPPDTWRWN